MAESDYTGSVAWWAYRETDCYDDYLATRLKVAFQWADPAIHTWGVGVSHPDDDPLPMTGEDIERLQHGVIGKLFDWWDRGDLTRTEYAFLQFGPCEFCESPNTGALGHGNVAYDEGLGGLKAECHRRVCEDCLDGIVAKWSRGPEQTGLNNWGESA
jgi:hypothetical protein